VVIPQHYSGIKERETGFIHPDKVKIYEYMMREGVKQEIEWGQYV